MPIDEFNENDRNPYSRIDQERRELIGWAVIFKDKLTGVSLASLDINVEDIVPLHLLMKGEFISLTAEQVERIRTIVSVYERGYRLGSH